MMKLSKRRRYKVTTLKKLFLLLGVLSICGAPVCFAEENVAPVATASSVSAEQEAAMEKVKTLMAPGEAHKLFEQFAGTWNFTSEMWMPGSATPEKSTGTSVNAVVYGGRFLKQDVVSTWMGEPFQGTACLGYDNVKKQYESLWVDSMSTSIMIESGQYDEATKTLTMTGTNSCPMTGEADHKSRSEMKFIDADHYSYTVYTNGPDGKEMKAMEIQYTRAI